jgi:hypothetical protein
MTNRRRLFMRTTSFALVASALASCGGGADEAAASAAEGVIQSTAVATSVDTFEVAVDPSALSTTPLSREMFVEDACRFASAQEIAAFFAFHDGPVSVEGDDGLYAGTECAYAMQGPDVFLEIQFSQLHTSGTEEVNLGGVDGVLRDVSTSTLENRARVQIPFGIAGSPVEAAVVQFHIRGVPPADEGAMRVAVEALAANLIERLGSEGRGVKSAG